MVIESSFIPFPSEVVIPPAAYLAYKGKLSLSGVILSGTLGSLMGALFNYYLALKLGRPAFQHLIKKYGKYILLTEYSLQRVDLFWNHHGTFSTFIGRLLPGIRQIISIPAGFARMGLFLFCLYTTLGAFIWVTFLALCGYFFGKNEVLLKEYLQRGSYTIVLLAILLVFIYILLKTDWKNKLLKKFFKP
ncbi:MAG: DedA family protein [Thermodesulfobacteriaceae bacterium]|nr:DedA family protein [Thermodesulfobacteriaceae bacterium]MCX8041393.1 DedA family protein [Thermodesulfobacteriaceae bacterium]MDW8135812.1 DedA family protein [Thermodesulfobacterium sp.]